MQTEGLAEGSVVKTVNLQLSSPIEEKNLTSLEGDGSSVVFEGVEVEQATLTVKASNDSATLGTSTAYDVASIVNDSSFTAKIELEGAEVCTLELDVMFSPSKDNQKEKLYEKLNEASKRKAVAVEELRKLATASSSTLSKPRSRAAVQAGFLNKKAPKSKYESFYDQYLGPQSWIQRVVPKYKNYVIFFLSVGLFHFQGYQLALPPPV